MEDEDEGLGEVSFFSRPLFLLRLEGLVWLVLMLYLFHYFHGSWVLFLSLFFVPDLSIFGFLSSATRGTALYNLAHTEIGPILLGGCGLAFGMTLLLQLGIIWFSHISFDRMIGFGLKYSDSFQHTHLGPFAFWRDEEG